MCYLREFRTFVAVYEERSFTLAAQRMNATQSGVSQQIKKIETVVGVRLFDRATRAVQPTEAGIRYYEHCLRLLTDYDRAIASFQDPEASSALQQIVIGVAPWLTPCLIPALTGRFSNEEGRMTVRFEEASAEVLTQRMRAGDLNFTISENDAPNGQSYGEGLLSECVLVTGRHERHRSQMLKPEAISTMNLILPPASNPLRAVADTHFATHGIRPRRIIEINSISAAINLAITSGWNAFVPVTALSGEIATINCIVDRLPDAPKVPVLVRSRRAKLTAAEQMAREILVLELNRLTLNERLILQAFSSSNAPDASHERSAEETDRASRSPARQWLS